MHTHANLFEVTKFECIPAPQFAVLRKPYGFPSLTNGQVTFQNFRTLMSQTKEEQY